MSFFDSLISLTKRNTDILYRFKKCITNVLSLKDIDANLEIIYECISYEQSRSDNYKCTEYFITNEISLSLLKLENLSHFFIKILSVLNKKYLIKISSQKIYLYDSSVCVVYAERLVACNIDDDFMFIDYIVGKFKESDNYRNSLILTFNLRNYIKKLNKMRFKRKIIEFLNKLDDDGSYIEIFEILHVFLQKEIEMSRIYSLEGSSNSDISIGNHANTDPVSNDEYINFEDLYKFNQADDFDLLDFKSKSINLYNLLIQKGINDSITKRIINEFTNKFTNNYENIEFLKFLIKNKPILMSERMSVILEDSEYIEYESKNNKQRSYGDFVDKLIEMKVDDIEIYKFLLEVNPFIYEIRKNMILSIIGKDIDNEMISA